MLRAKQIKLLPIVKYPGGKSRELVEIIPELPNHAENFYEPFIGGGAVYFALDADKKYINDKSTELINLYEMIKTQNKEFFEKIERLDYDWGLLSEVVVNHQSELSEMYIKFRNDDINEEELKSKVVNFVKNNKEEFNGLLTPDFSIDVHNFVDEMFKSINSKFKRMKKLELTKGVLSDQDLTLNIEGAFKSAFYMHFRYLYNNIDKLDISTPFATAIYMYIREYCYASMFRYNNQGEFNVPYGGISYNNKSLKTKINYYKSEELKAHLNNTIVENLDFYDFMKKYIPSNNDFIFLDPPYDTEFSTYANNEFGRQDQERLAKYLIQDNKAYFMMIIKDTPFIQSLYVDGTELQNDRILRVSSFEKKYSVNIKARNKQKVTHLIIKNY